jgi:hypothetical protein
MTQKEAEEILVAAGWRLVSWQQMTRKWVVDRDGSLYVVNVWKGSTGFSSRENGMNMAAVPQELLLPKEIADVLRHCS